MDYRDLKPGTSFKKDGKPYTVLEFNFEKKQRQAPTVKVEVRNLLDSKTKQMTIRQHEEIEEADVKKVKAEFVYNHRGSYVFKDPEDPSIRPELSEDMVGDKKNFLKEGLKVDLIKFEGDIVDIELPDKVDLEVIQAPPAVKGNTADGGTKQVKTETGYEVKTPLFTEKGAIIRVNTDTGEYTERVEKSN